MKPFREWKFEFKGALILAIPAAIVLAGQVVSSIPIIEPVLLATRGYARDVVQTALEKEAAQKKQIAEGLKETTIGILDLKLTALDGQIEALETTLKMVEARRIEEPGDQLLRELEKKVKDDIASKKAIKQVTVCELLRARYPGSVCSP
jgi:hypothetical protein